MGTSWRELVSLEKAEIWTHTHTHREYRRHTGRSWPWAWSAAPTSESPPHPPPGPRRCGRGLPSQRAANTWIQASGPWAGRQETAAVLSLWFLVLCYDNPRKLVEPALSLHAVFPCPTLGETCYLRTLPVRPSQLPGAYFPSPALAPRAWGGILLASPSLLGLLPLTPILPDPQLWISCHWLSPGTPWLQSSGLEVISYFKNSRSWLTVRGNTASLFIYGDFRRYLNGPPSSLTLLFLECLSYSDVISATQASGHTLDLDLPIMRPTCYLRSRLHLLPPALHVLPGYRSVTVVTSPHIPLFCCPLFLYSPVLFCLTQPWPCLNLVLPLRYLGSRGGL